MKNVLDLTAFVLAILTKLKTRSTVTESQLEKIVYNLLRTDLFSPFFIEVAKKIGKMGKGEVDSFLGKNLDYRTTAITARIKNKIPSAKEEQVKRIRFAVMNVIRDEGVRYSATTRGDRMMSGELVSGQHTDYHVAKGRKDEDQVFIQSSLAFLDTLSSEDVTHDSRVVENAESVYDNDRTRLISEKTENALEKFFRKHDQITPRSTGEGKQKDIVQSALQGYKAMLSRLENAGVWKFTSKSAVQNHLTRLSLSRSLRSQLDQAEKDRLVARRYYISGNTYMVPVIGNDQNSELCYVVSTFAFKRRILVSMGNIAESDELQAKKHIKSSIDQSEVKEQVRASLYESFVGYLNTLTESQLDSAIRLWDNTLARLDQSDFSLDVDFA